MRIRIMVLLLFALVTLGLGCSCAPVESKSEKHPAPKTEASKSETPNSADNAAPIAWQSWSDSVFDKAKAEHKLVLLHLGAVWCHWCHVMEHTTYEDPTVVGIVRESFLAVRVDQDERPDLSMRYQDYGWPATILFDQDGRELALLQGYLPKERMIPLLRAFVADPTPGPSALNRGHASEAPPTLSPELRAAWRVRLVGAYDEEHGGWGTVHKYLDPDTIEYSLRAALAGDAELERMGKATLDLSRKLVDPVWGGVYQYSDGGVWENPHFEKIMQYQAGDLRIHALAYEQLRDPAALHTARDLCRFLEGFLSRPDGAFFTSEDADLEPGKHSAEYFAQGDKARRARGIPPIDQHVYARENGWAIEAMVALFAATKEGRFLDRAKAAAEIMIRERGLEGGGFRHDAKDTAGPYLGDTLAMGRAFLALHQATSDPRWLELAKAAARFTEKTFRLEAGFATAVSHGPLASAADPSENLDVARWLNLLGHVAADAGAHTQAEHAFRFAVAEAGAHGPAAALLLADSELASEPMHVTIAGVKGEPAADALFAAALELPTTYKVIDWKSPEGGAAAAFLCGRGVCSAPVTEPNKVRATFDKLSR